MDWLFRRFSLSEDLGIDLGTANTLVASQDRGILLDEPSVVAVYKGTNEVILDGMGVGDEAYRMLGKTPTNIEAVRPLKGGVIADFEITEKLLRYFLRKAHEGRSWVRPRVVISVPSGITTVERRAVINSAERAGARKVYLVDEPMAAGLGVELPITEAQGSMVVDIGGGTTEVAIMSLADIATCESVRVAGDDFDEAIIQHMKKTYNLTVGEQTAERIKIEIGSAAKVTDDTVLEVRGRDNTTGLPGRTEVTSEEIREALQDPVRSIVDAVKRTLDRAEPELAADLIDNGICLVGGGALLRGIDVVINQETKLDVSIAEDPLTCVARGTSTYLENLEEWKSTMGSDMDDL